MSASENLRGRQRESETEKETAADRDLRINSHFGLSFARQCRILHRNVSYYLLSILLLLSTGVDLWRHEPVLWFFWPLLSADSNQRPWSCVFSGAVWDSGTGFPAALQLHCLEPLRHWHRSGHTEGARYKLTGVIIPTRALYRSYSDTLNPCCEEGQIRWKQCSCCVLILIILF